MQIATFKAATATGGDTTPPTVAITEPPTGTVSGTFAVTANATDNVGVAGVQFLLDNNPLGAEDTSAALQHHPQHHHPRQRHPHPDRARPRRRRQHHHLGTRHHHRQQRGYIPACRHHHRPDRNGLRHHHRHRQRHRQCGVAGVQFRVDNNPISAEDTTAPYSATLNTTTLTNGTHTLTAIARDTSGNTATSAPVTITVANSRLRRRRMCR